MITVGEIKKRRQCIDIKNRNVEWGFKSEIGRDRMLDYHDQFFIDQCLIHLIGNL